MISIDIETCCNVTGCSGFGKADDNHCNHALSPWHNRITVVAAWDGKVGEVFRDLTELDDYLNFHFREEKLVAYNFKFEHLNLNHHGVHIDMDRWLGDPFLMAYTSTDKIPDQWLASYKLARAEQPGKHRKGSKHSLKTVAPFFLGVAPFWETEDKDDDEYVLKDTQYAYELFNYFENKLKAADEYDFYQEKLFPWTKMLLAAEMRGVVIDLQALDTLEQELKIKSVELKKQLDLLWADAHHVYGGELRLACIEKYAQMAKNQGKALIESPRHMKLLEAARLKVPRSVDYDSPKQMLWLLRDYHGYNCESIDGGDSTEAAVLERLASEGKEDVALYLEWRAASKVLSMYIPTYRDLQEGGTLHAIYNPGGTRTGRLSCERPNLQQVPGELKHLFKAREGYVFVGYDAAAIEAKLIALYTEDPVLLEIILSGNSLHDHNTKVYFDLETPIEEIKRLHPKERDASKRCGFSLYYNAGANRIRSAFAGAGYLFSKAKCIQMHSRFKQSFQVAMKQAAEVVNYLEQGKTLLNLLGRPIAVENPEDAYMKGFNKLIQSSASDLNLEAAYRAWNEAKSRGLDATPVLFVHDFDCFEVKKEHAEEFDKILVNSMTNFKLETEHGLIPLTVEGGIMSRWEK